MSLSPFVTLLLKKTLKECTIFLLPVHNLCKSSWFINYLVNAINISHMSVCKEQRHCKRGQIVYVISLKPFRREQLKKGNCILKWCLHVQSISLKMQLSERRAFTKLLKSSHWFVSDQYFSVKYFSTCGSSWKVTGLTYQMILKYKILPKCL